MYDLDIIKALNERRFNELKQRQQDKRGETHGIVQA